MDLTKALFVSKPQKDITENDILSVINVLDEKHYSELLEYLETLYVKQAIKQNKKNDTEKDETESN